MRTRLTSLDGTESVDGELVRPETYRQLFAAMQEGGACIPRGAGFSYCAASAGGGVRSLSSSRFDRCLAFDGDRGLLTVESGKTVGDLLLFAAERGWYPPVLPGHPKITVGGCIGFNVHGKSQHHEGHFSRCVESLTLFHPDHGEVECSREIEPELFDLTLGGFGLTGFVTSATLRLIPRPGGSLRRRRIPVADLNAAVEVMEARCDEADCLYSWNDLSRRGAAFGRGVVYAESFEPETIPGAGEFRDLDAALRRRPGWSVFRGLSTRLMNRVYGRLEAVRGESLLDLESGAFPINGKEFYYTFFGRRGFREYQMLIPRSAWSEAVPEIERLVSGSGLAPTLGSLKLFDGDRKMLDFAGSGICLTIDVPATPAALELFTALDEVVLAAGGVVNIAKDSRLTAATVRRMFADVDRFEAGLRAWDPDRRFDSHLRRRLLG